MNKGRVWSLVRLYHEAISKNHVTGDEIAEKKTIIESIMGHDNSNSHTATGNSRLATWNKKKCFSSAKKQMHFCEFRHSRLQRKNFTQLPQFYWIPTAQTQNGISWHTLQNCKKRSFQNLRMGNIIIDRGMKMKKKYFLTCTTQKI